MLVLTRRPGEKIVFPGLGITVHLLHSSARAMKVGVDAPAEIRILREEIADQEPAAATAGAAASAPAAPTQGQRAHARANALSKITLALHLARKQWEAGRPAAADATLAAALAAVEELDRPEATPAPPSRCRALVVDDDANQRELLAGLLDMNGCECITAADGEDALAYLAANTLPDVVLLDMAMPRCDGPETLRRIRADRRLARLRVFSVSSTRPDATGEPGAFGGFDGWFPKPLNPRRLWDAMQDATGSPAAAN
jgi:carbon storage regulator CsrA